LDAIETALSGDFPVQACWTW